MIDYDNLVSEIMGTAENTDWEKWGLLSDDLSLKVTVVSEDGEAFSIHFGEAGPKKAKHMAVAYVSPDSVDLAFAREVADELIEQLCESMALEADPIQ